MQGSDNTPELRARLRRTSRFDYKAALVHDFRNRLTELCFATGTGDNALIDFHLTELIDMYRDALGPKCPRRAA